MFFDTLQGGCHPQLEPVVITMKFRGFGWGFFIFGEGLNCPKCQIWWRGCYFISAFRAQVPSPWFFSARQSSQCRAPSSNYEWASGHWTPNFAHDHMSNPNPELRPWSLGVLIWFIGKVPLWSSERRAPWIQQPETTRSMTQGNVKVGKREYMRSHSNICFHLSADMCPRGDLHRILLSFYLPCTLFFHINNRHWSPSGKSDLTAQTSSACELQHNLMGGWWSVLREFHRPFFSARSMRGENSKVLAINTTIVTFKERHGEGVGM